MVLLNVNWKLSKTNQLFKLSWTLYDNEMWIPHVQDWIWNYFIYDTHQCIEHLIMHVIMGHGKKNISHGIGMRWIFIKETDIPYVCKRKGLILYSHITFREEWSCPGSARRNTAMVPGKESCTFNFSILSQNHENRLKCGKSQGIGDKHLV